MPFPIDQSKKDKIIKLLDLKDEATIPILESYLNEHFLPLNHKNTIYEELKTTGKKSKSREELTNQIEKLRTIETKTSDLKNLISNLDPNFQSRLSERVSIQLPKLNLPSTSQHKIIPVNAIMDLIQEECNHIANDFGSAYKKLLAKPLQSLEEFWIFTLQKPPPPMTLNCLFDQFAAILLERSVEAINKARKDNR